ncbi:MAG: anthranilate phosphoribosyltransferase [Holosporales bacterium]|jgi:anthranilate phosphoribosyltransferase
MTPRAALERLLDAAYINRAEAEGIIDAFLDPTLEPSLAGGAVALLAQRPITPDLLTGAVSAIRAAMIPATTTARTLDTCGTGGDAKGSYNISTATALLIAACGVPVAKHGNRAVSGSVGSADVLEALGVPLDGDGLDTNGFGFFFAPNHHPKLAAIGSARRVLRLRSLFNIAAPLCNPTRPVAQLVGVYSPSLVEVVAHTLNALGTPRALVVCSNDGLDELTPSAPSRVAEVRDGVVIVRYSDAAEAGLPPCALNDLRGGTVADNAAAIKGLGDGTAPEAFRNAVLYNAAACLYLYDKVSTFKEGAAEAKALLDNGQFQTFLAKITSFSFKQ